MEGEFSVLKATMVMFEDKIIPKAIYEPEF